MQKVFLLLLVFFFQGEFQKDEDYLRIVSWNIEGLGKKDEDHFQKIAEKIKDADVVAIQEVPVEVGEKKLQELLTILNSEKNEWRYKMSDSTRSFRKGTKERYAFLWKSSRIDTILYDGLIDELDSQIHREPYMVRFKIQRKQIDLVNIHVCQSLKGCPENEIGVLSKYFSSPPLYPTILLGDFNSSEKNNAFKSLHKTFESALKSEKTILSEECDSTGFMSSATDNFFFSNKIELITAGVSIQIDCDNFEIIKDMSNHVPIYMTLRIE